MPSTAAVPKNVLILSEGPVLPSGVLRENIIAGLRTDSIDPLNIRESSSTESGSTSIVSGTRDELVLSIADSGCGCGSARDWTGR